MANDENIRGKGFDSRTTEEQREIARKGGIASGEARRRKKSIKETLDILLECKPTDKDLALMRAQGVDVDNDATYRQAIAFSIVNRAMKGNTRAFELIRDTVGEMPVQKVAISEVDDELIDEVEREVLADDEE